MREDGIFEAAQTCHYYNQLPTVSDNAPGFRTGVRLGLDNLNHCIARTLADPYLKRHPKPDTGT